MKKKKNCKFDFHLFCFFAFVFRMNNNNNIKTAINSVLAEYSSLLLLFYYYLCLYLLSINKIERQRKVEEYVNSI